MAGGDATSPFRGRYRPAEKLSTFHGMRARGEWVLAAYDYDVDSQKGRLTDFKLHFTVAECEQTFHWRQVAVNSSSETPDARSQHAAMVVGSSLFVFGGRTTKTLHDLWRFDRHTVSN